MHSFPNLEPVYCSISGSSCCFLTCIQISQEAIRWSVIHISWRIFPQFVVIHTVKDFGVVNKAEVDVILEKAMAPHSSTLAWQIPWMEKPGGLQSMGSLRVRHDWVTSISLFTFMHWRRKWQPTPVFLPGVSQGRGSQGAAIYGVTQSRTWLKRLNSNSNRYLSRILFLFWWSNGCWLFDLWFLCLF